MITAQKTSVLVVDDDTILRELLVKVLTIKGYTVLDADNGSKALDILDREDVDIVVTDLQMPKMDGIELCQRIKDHKIVPVILCTAHREEFGDRKYPCIDKLISKPFRLEHVVEAIEDCLAMH